MKTLLLFTTLLISSSVVYSQSQLVPVNDIDSTCDPYNHVWAYTYDAIHEYYTSICKDSLITYTVNGNLSSRDFLQWDSTRIYQTYKLTQTWNGANWVNSAEFETPTQFGCYMKYDIGKIWNGNSWDTTYAYKEVLSFDIYGRISERHYYKYVNNEWLTYRDVFPHYANSNDTIIGIDDYHYNTLNGQLSYASKDTNYVWLAFSSLCSNIYSEFFIQSYDIPSQTWVNSGKEIYAGQQVVGSDTFFNYVGFAWNGASYDSSQAWYIKHDYTGNWIEYHSQTYNFSTHTWYTDYVYRYNYTYGPGNEILRKEYLAFDCAPNFDSIFPCYVHNYSNFTSCIPTETAQLISSDEETTIYPNPSQYQLFISLSSRIVYADIEVYDEQGKRLSIPFTIRNTTAELNIQNLVAGFYVVQIRDKVIGTISHMKFIKQN